MYAEADGFATTLNSLFDSKEAATGLVVALLGFAGTQTWGRLFSRRRKLTWRVLYDEPVNLGNKDAPVADGTGSWVITYRGLGDEPAEYEVRYGSLTVAQIAGLYNHPGTAGQSSYIACSDLGGSDLGTACNS